MTLRVLRAADRTAVPWKNGGGVTREIAASPEGAPLDDFDWRVSLADVSADGPFSSFPGVDRTLTVVEGAGMDLMVGGEHHIVDEQYWPHDFPGDLETDGRLLGGPVVNLNVMYRRERTTAEVAVVRGTLGCRRRGAVRSWPSRWRTVRCSTATTSNSTATTRWWPTVHRPECYGPRAGRSWSRCP